MVLPMWPLSYYLFVNVKNKFYSLYQDILKNTFKEALNKISVEKQKTKEEYNKEMNKINNYLSFQNKENEILVSYNKNFEPLLTF